MFEKEVVSPCHGRNLVPHGCVYGDGVEYETLLVLDSEQRRYVRVDRHFFYWDEWIKEKIVNDPFK